MARSTVCIGCGNPTTNGSRCIDCNRGFRRAVRNPAYDDPRWRKRRTRDLAEHRAKHGDICPGYKRPPHPASRLTDDHIDPLALGGDLLGPTQILCDSCNTRKRHDQTPTRRVRTARPS